MKKRLIAVIIICMFIFTGCTRAIELTEEQNELVAEYAAGVLVKNSYTYKTKYAEFGRNPNSGTEEETETPSETETETEKPQDTDDVNNGALAYASKALGIEPVEVTYKSYKVVDEYPDDEDALFTVIPEPGYKFVVVLFNLHNPGDKAVTLNTAENSTIFKATINKASVNNFATLLLNDITALSDVTIEAGADYEGVVMFMISEDAAEGMNSFRLSYKYEGTSYSLQLK